MPGADQLGLHHVGRRFRRAAIEVDVEAHAAVRQQRRVVEREVMLGRADRTAVERRHDRTPVVAVGRDVEHDHEGEQREREIAEAAVGLRQGQRAGDPAEPGSFAEPGIAAQPRVVERVGAGTPQQKRGAHREVGRRHRPLVDAGGTLCQPNISMSATEKPIDTSAAARVNSPRDQAGAGDQLGGTEHDHSPCRAPRSVGA